MAKCKITEIAGRNKKLQPTLVEFEHGSLKNNSNAAMKCDVISEDDSQSTTYLAWRNREKSIILKGTKVQPKDEINQTLLLIRNKRTNKIRVVQTERLVVSNIVNHDELLASRKITDQTVSQQEVTLMFGSKKAQRQAVLSSRLQLNQDIVKSKLETSVADIQVNVDDLNTSKNAGHDILPRCNENAKKVEDVYQLFDLVPEDVFESLSDAAEQVKENPPKKSDGDFTEFFIKCISSQPAILKSPKQLKCLLYIDSLIRFFDVKAKDLKTDVMFKICPHSKYVRNYITNTFSQLHNKTRLRPRNMRDKAATHSLVCLMIAFQFSMPIQIFQWAFPFYNAKRLQEFGKALRFSSTTSANWTLKLPLPSANTFAKKKKVKR